MGCKGSCGYLLKPWNFLATLAWLALLVYAIYVFGMYKQASLHPGVPPMIPHLIRATSLSSFVFDNLSKACTGFLSLYLGIDFTHKLHNKGEINKPISSYSNVAQCEATLLFLKYQVEVAPVGSLERKQAQQELDDEMSHRYHTDCAIKEIGKALFGEENYYEMIMTTHSPIVNDWDCYKTMPDAYVKHCGVFNTYGFMKYMQAFANMCNAGLRRDQVAEVASQVCNHKCITSKK